MNLPDRFQAALIWGMIIIVMSVLGWGLTRLIRISEHASPDSGMELGSARSPASTLSEKKASQAVKKVQTTAQQKAVVKVITERVREPVKNPVKRDALIRPVHNPAVPSLAKPHPFGRKEVQPTKKMPATHKIPEPITIGPIDVLP
ncbi:MAG: hypothetical protein Q9M27_06950 [Mariprofundaceae bacterium]|nr:hypothetical protein [Mariprofundaceae bacterium]